MQKKESRSKFFKPTSAYLHLWIVHLSGYYWRVSCFVFVFFLLLNDKTVFVSPVGLKFRRLFSCTTLLFQRYQVQPLIKTFLCLLSQCCTGRILHRALQPFLLFWPCPSISSFYVHSSSPPGYLRNPRLHRVLPLGWKCPRLLQNYLKLEITGSPVGSGCLSRASHWRKSR